MIVFLSPHLDDAVFSCGAYIAQLAADGEAVNLLTVMAGDPPDPLPDTPLVRELHARWSAGDNPVAARREEDLRAAAILSWQGSNRVRTTHMMLLDCVYRTHDGFGLYTEGDTDLFGPVHPDDPAQAMLSTMELPDASAMTQLYAPLGVGNHVDHQLVRNWSIRLAQQYKGIPLYFYAEYPYSASKDAVKTTLMALDLPLEAVYFSVQQDDIEKWQQASACYTSQISTFWQGEADMRSQMNDYLQNMSTDTTLTQRCWHVRQNSPRL